MDEVNELIKKAAEAKQPHEARHFSQAALNAAHALQVLQQIKKNA